MRESWVMMRCFSDILSKLIPCFFLFVSLKVDAEQVNDLFLSGDFRARFTKGMVETCF